MDWSLGGEWGSARTHASRGGGKAYPSTKDELATDWSLGGERWSAQTHASRGGGKACPSTKDELATDWSLGEEWGSARTHASRGGGKAYPSTKDELATVWSLGEEWGSARTHASRGGEENLIPLPRTNSLRTDRFLKSEEGHGHAKRDKENVMIRNGANFIRLTELQPLQVPSFCRKILVERRWLNPSRQFNPRGRVTKKKS